MGTNLCCDQGPHGIINVALHTDLLLQTAVSENLGPHPEWNSNCLEPADITTSFLKSRARALVCTLTTNF